MFLRNKALLVYILLISCNLFSLDFSKPILSKKDKSNYLFVTPSLDFGTHINSVGLNIGIGKRFILNENQNIMSINLEGFNISNAYYSNIGIPNHSLSNNIGASLGFSFGKKIRNNDTNNYFREVSRHTIKYYFSYYFSTDKTNQTYGGVRYNLSLDNSDISFLLDNDDGYFIATDKYRTTKAEIKYIYYSNQNFYGLSVGFQLWTGKLDGTENKVSKNRRENYYSLTGYGSEYSHGIAKLTLIYNHINLSIGYDSESIRDFIQNGWHNFYNRPRVPLVDREDRFFIQFSLFPSMFSY